MPLKKLIKSTKKGTNWSLPRYYGDLYAYKSLQTKLEFIYKYYVQFVSSQKGASAQ